VNTVLVVTGVLVTVALTLEWLVGTGTVVIVRIVAVS
jgi:hypothetical protein